MNQNDFKAFTLKGEGYINPLVTSAIVAPNQLINPDSSNKEVVAIWDTGASISAISSRVAKECNLQMTGKTITNTANGPLECNKYLIGIVLPNQMLIQNVEVTECNLDEKLDMLIGMNVILAGDFSVTNVNNTTTFSFRMPSCEEIDYVKDSNDNIINSLNNQIKQLEKNVKSRSSSKCECGSKKSYKNCCGPKLLKDAKKQREEILRQIENSNMPKTKQPV